ncbi:unnamed protein product [Arabis nemorensis]|uniref:Polygalacturonase n=1 Tax=Arabis nemorensis TaxID=586526 RepID=A0A565CMZ3_9BRAS|nr:unnamed protein product [Arabis nemorensis]
MVKEWGSKTSECWLCFDKVTGLVLDGSGLLNGNGGNWWPSVECSSRPVAVKFSGCEDITYNGLTQKDSPRSHISVFSSTNVTFSNIHLIAPENSPNTDGIDISLSHNIHIFSSSITTGDDCVAIKGGSYDINITDVACGPGHGISIGSLGKGGAIDTVQNVNVRHCSFKGTQNGARIKTWPGGRGFVKNIVYENITLINAQFPIIIDQQYSIGASYFNPTATTNAVKVSDVTFKYFRGTCADATAIKLDCDKNLRCGNIVMEHINITSSSPKTPLTVFCQFADVISQFVSIDIKCGSHEDPQAPSPAPIAPPPSLYI